MRESIAASVPPHWWERLRGAQFGFVGGLIVGLLLGWFFHGVISLFVGMGVLFLFLLPLLVIGWLWWRARSASTPGKVAGSHTVYVSRGVVLSSPTPSSERRHPEPVIEVEAMQEPPRADVAAEIERELARLKGQ